jgi:ornithine carbamoyltransferase
MVGVCMQLQGRSFLTLTDFSADEITGLLELSARVKRERREGRRLQRLAGYSLAMVFEKLSTRTRCAFESAIGEEGGHPVFLGSHDIHLGKKESLEDSARVFGSMFDVVAYRGHGQNIVETLSRYAGVPIINALTDETHPTQTLADLLTIQEEFKTLKGISIAYMGDGRNNVAYSLLAGCAIMGMRCTIVAPEGYQPDTSIFKALEPQSAASGAELRTDPDLRTGLKDADVVYTDVWVSMGMEAETAERERILSPYKVDDSVMAMTGNGHSIFMHCLPAVKEKEVSAAVFEGQRSRVWPEAENRKHTIKAIILALLGLS